MSFEKQRIWIIGASSGIGYEIAKNLHESGADLILSARRKEELEKLNTQLQGKHEVKPLDVINHEEVKNVIDEISENKIDRVIFLPALYKPDSIENMDLDFAKKMLDVNIMGVFYVTKYLVEIFKKQKSGQLAICGSVAGYVGLPNGQPYSATKAAIINFVESLKAEMPNYIDIKLISPGFVETPLTEQNKFKMPMIITSEKAANYICKGLVSKSFEINFPKRLTYLLKFVDALPYFLKLKITKKMVTK